MPILCPSSHHEKGYINLDTEKTGSKIQEKPLRQTTVSKLKQNALIFYHRQRDPITDYMQPSKASEAFQEDGLSDAEGKIVLNPLTDDLFQTTNL